METFDGDPSSAIHAYNDFHDFTYPGDEGGGGHPAHTIVSAAVTGESGTYVVHSIEYDIDDVLPIASVKPIQPISTKVNPTRSISRMSILRPRFSTGSCFGATNQRILL